MLKVDAKAMAAQEQDYAIAVCQYLLSTPKHLSTWQAMSSKERNTWLDTEGFSTTELKKSHQAIAKNQEQTYLAHAISALLYTTATPEQIAQVKLAIHQQTSALIGQAGGTAHRSTGINTPLNPRNRQQLLHELSELRTERNTNAVKQSAIEASNNTSNPPEINQTLTKPKDHHSNTLELEHSNQENLEPTPKEKLINLHQTRTQKLAQANVVLKVQRQIKEQKWLDQTIKKTRRDTREDQIINELEHKKNKGERHHKQAVKQWQIYNHWAQWLTNGGWLKLEKHGLLYALSPKRTNANDTPVKGELSAMEDPQRIWFAKFLAKNTEIGSYIQYKEEPSLIVHFGRGPGCLTEWNQDLHEDATIEEENSQSKETLQDNRRNIDFRYVNKQFHTDIKRSLYHYISQNPRGNQTNLQELLIDSRIEKIINPKTWSRERTRLWSSSIQPKASKNKQQLKTFNLYRQTLEAQRSSLKIKKSTQHLNKAQTATLHLDEDRDEIFLAKKYINTRGSYWSDFYQYSSIEPGNQYLQNENKYGFWEFNLGHNPITETTQIGFTSINGKDYIWYATPKTLLGTTRILSIKGMQHALNQSFINTWRIHQHLKDLTASSRIQTLSYLKDSQALRWSKTTSEDLIKNAQKRESVHQCIQLNRNLLTADLGLWTNSKKYIQTNGWSNHSFFHDLRTGEKYYSSPLNILESYKAQDETKKESKGKTKIQKQRSKNGKSQGLLFTDYAIFSNQSSNKKTRESDALTQTTSLIESTQTNALSVASKEYSHLISNGISSKRALQLANLTYLNELLYMDAYWLTSSYLGYQVQGSKHHFNKGYGDTSIDTNNTSVSAFLVPFVFPLMIKSQIRNTKTLWRIERLQGLSRRLAYDTYKEKKKLIDSISGNIDEFYYGMSLKNSRVGYHIHEDFIKPIWSATLGQWKWGQNLGIFMHTMMHGLTHMPITFSKDLGILETQFWHGLTHPQNWGQGGWFNALGRDTKGTRNLIEYFGNWLGFCFTFGGDRKALYTSQRIVRLFGFMPLLENHDYVKLAVTCQLFELQTRSKLHYCSYGLIRSPLQCTVHDHKKLQRWWKKTKSAAQAQEQKLAPIAFLDWDYAQQGKQYKVSWKTYFRQNYAAEDRRSVRHWRHQFKRWRTYEMASLTSKQISNWAWHTIHRTYDQISEAIRLTTWCRSKQAPRRIHHATQIIGKIDLFAETIQQIETKSKAIAKTIQTDGDFNRQDSSTRGSGEMMMNHDLYYPITYTMTNNQIKDFNKIVYGHKLGDHLFTDIMLSYSISNQALELVSTAFKITKNLIIAAPIIHSKIKAILSMPLTPKQSAWLNRIYAASERDQKVARIISTQKQDYQNLKKSTAHFKETLSKMRKSNNHTLDQQIQSIKRRYNTIEQLKAIGRTKVSARTISKIMANGTPLENLCIDATNTKVWKKMSPAQKKEVEAWYQWNQSNNDDKAHWASRYKKDESNNDYQTQQLNKDYKEIEAGDTMSVGEIIASLKPSGWKTIPRIQPKSHSLGHENPPPSNNSTPQSNPTTAPTTLPMAPLLPTLIRCKVVDHILNKLLGGDVTDETSGYGIKVFNKLDIKVDNAGDIYLERRAEIYKTDHKGKAEEKVESDAGADATEEGTLAAEASTEADTTMVDAMA